MLEWSNLACYPQQHLWIILTAMLASFWQWAMSRKLRDMAHKIAAPVLLDIAVLPFIFVTPVSNWIGSRAFLCSVLSQCVSADESWILSRW